ncbi:unnamed protein product [Protopolystoma xenopodis]|uniref:Uncharacterized protein n=1 Tax=Protopolystoma xenopodis TaxID=117903 RepID=A0A448WYT3_9PLAT|nr:unnamed protein product [Protopolystoma xenopodis]
MGSVVAVDALAGSCQRVAGLVVGTVAALLAVEAEPTDGTCKAAPLAVEACRTRNQSTGRSGAEDGRGVEHKVEVMSRKAKERREDGGASEEE